MILEIIKDVLKITQPRSPLPHFDHKVGGFNLARPSFIYWTKIFVLWLLL